MRLLSTVTILLLFGFSSIPQPSRSFWPSCSIECKKKPSPQMLSFHFPLFGPKSQLQRTFAYGTGNACITHTASLSPTLTKTPNHRTFLVPHV